MIESGVIIKIIVAAFLGALVGFERQTSRKDAGLRTHTLLALASCVLIIVGIKLGSFEITRIVQGIVTGMGFIGAGAIMSNESKIRGITTAASLWTVTIIGIAVGFGYYDLAVVTSIVVLIILWLGKVEYEQFRKIRNMKKKR